MAVERGHGLTVLDVPELDRWPAPTGHDAIVGLGSDVSVHAYREPKVAREVAFLRDAHLAGVTTSGHQTRV